MSKINYICKWIFFAISNFTITEKVASRNSSEVVYIGDLSRHWIISKGTQIPKGIGWYKLKPATKPTVIVQSNLFKLQNPKSRHCTSLVFQVNWSSYLVDFTVDVSESAPSLPILTPVMSSIARAYLQLPLGTS